MAMMRAEIEQLAGNRWVGFVETAGVTARRSTLAGASLEDILTGIVQARHAAEGGLGAVAAVICPVDRFTGLPAVAGTVADAAPDPEGDYTTDVIDELSGGQSADAGVAPASRRRGRPPGSRNVAREPGDAEQEP
jgi:hypothetical protein